MKLEPENSPKKRMQSDKLIVKFASTKEGMHKLESALG